MARLTTVGGSSARYCFSASESMAVGMVTGSLVATRWTGWRGWVRFKWALLAAYRVRWGLRRARGSYTYVAALDRLEITHATQRKRDHGGKTIEGTARNVKIWKTFVLLQQHSAVCGHGKFLAG